MWASSQSEKGRTNARSARLGRLFGFRLVGPNGQVHVLTQKVEDKIESFSVAMSPCRANLQPDVLVGTGFLLDAVSDVGRRFRVGGLVGHHQISFSVLLMMAAKRTASRGDSSPTAKNRCGVQRSVYFLPESSELF